MQRTLQASVISLLLVLGQASCTDALQQPPIDAMVYPDRPPLPRCNTTGLLVTRGLNYISNRFWYETRPMILSDHHGGVLVAYNQIRYHGLDLTDIKSYMSTVKRFSPAGKQLYGDLGVQVSHDGNIATLLNTSPSPEDRWPLTWFEWENHEYKTGKTFAQVINLDSSMQWSNAASLDTWDCNSIIPDGSGGFVIVCGIGGIEIQRLNSKGLALFPSILNLGAGPSSITVDHGDGSGGIVYSSWVNYPTGKTLSNHSVTIQHIDGTGKPVFAKEGRPITVNDRQYYIASSLVEVGKPGKGLALAVLEGPDARTSSIPINDQPLSLYVTRVDRDGNVTWPSGKAVLIADTKTYKEVRLFLGDGAEGVVVTWIEDRNGDGKQECYGQRALGTGALAWAHNGRLLTGATDGLCQIANGSIGDVFTGGAIRLQGGFAVVQDVMQHGYTGLSSSGRMVGLVVQRYDWDLKHQWSQPAVLTSCPTPMPTSSQDPHHNGIVTDGQGGMWVLWEEGPGEHQYLDKKLNLGIFGMSSRLQRISAEGKLYFPAASSGQ